MVETIKDKQTGVSGDEQKIVSKQKDNKNIKKGCLGCLGIIAAIFIIGLLINLVTAPKEKPFSDAKIMVVVEDTKVYDYSGIEASVVGYLKRGEKVQAYPSRGGWYRVWWNVGGETKTGYVMHFKLSQSE